MTFENVNARRLSQLSSNADFGRKLGGEYRLRNIGLHRWGNLAEELHIDPGGLIRRVTDFAKDLGDHVSDVKRRMTDEGTAHPIIRCLADEPTARSLACRRILHLT
jgi:hypothetical protein